MQSGWSKGMATPVWQRTRDDRWRDERLRRRFGWKTPRLVQIALVEPEAIDVPGWALAKAIPGLTSDRSKVWLRRIAANLLCRLDQEAGGTPKLTVTSYRPCRLCGRALLDAEAEGRLALDRQYEGHRIPCGPDCMELEKARKKKGGKRGGPGEPRGGGVRHPFQSAAGAEARTGSGEAADHA